MRLQDKVIVVTGATRGIGAAVVKACAQEGATAYIGAWKLDEGEELVASLAAEGLKVKCVYNDATKPETFRTMAEEVLANEGRIDGLVNNFGGTDPRIDKSITDTDYEDFLKGVDVNIGSVFLGCQAVLPTRGVRAPSSTSAPSQARCRTSARSPTARPRQPSTT